MANLTVRLDDELAADAQALARVEGRSLNDALKQALNEAVERAAISRSFKRKPRRAIEEDRELLGQLAR